MRSNEKNPSTKKLNFLSNMKRVLLHFNKFTIEKKKWSHEIIGDVEREREKERVSYLIEKNVERKKK